MSMMPCVAMNIGCANRYRLALFSKLLLVSILTSCGAWNAGAQAWVNGDVFVGVANGQYNVYSNAGVFKQFSGWVLPPWAKARWARASANWSRLRPTPCWDRCFRPFSLPFSSTSNCASRVAT